MSRQAYPLSWPNGWKRTLPAQRTRARFSKKETQYGNVDSTGHRSSWQRSKEISIADAVGRILHELSAIAATLSAMRAIERHGGATILDRAFLGFAALPERATQAWRETLGIGEGLANLDIVEQRFRSLAKVHHPDTGGDSEIVQAREAARMELIG